MVLLRQFVKIFDEPRKLDQLHKYVSEILGRIKVNLWHEIEDDVYTSIVSLGYGNMERRYLLVRFCDTIILGFTVMQNLKLIRVYWLQIFEHILKESMVHVNEVSIDKAGRFVEQIIVGLKVKDIPILKLILYFDLVFDYESHVAKRKSKILLKNQPIMIIAIKPMPFRKFRSL